MLECFSTERRGSRLLAGVARQPVREVLGALLTNPSMPESLVDLKGIDQASIFMPYFDRGFHRRSRCARRRI